MRPGDVPNRAQSYVLLLPLDAPVVAESNHRLRGSQHSAFLVSHEWPEGRGRGVIVGLSSTDLLSLSMQRRIAMAIGGVAGYRLQQGYAGEQIVILTPYLASFRCVAPAARSALIVPGR
jgi:hypothetical protein